MAIIPAHQIGEVVRDGVIVSKQYKPIDTDTIDFCWLHNIKLSSDWRNPNEYDKKQLHKIRLTKHKLTEKDGKSRYIRMCTKCHRILEYTRQP